MMPARHLLVRAGLLFDGLGNPPRSNVGLTVRDGLIHEIVTDDMLTRPSEVREVDLGMHRSILPGFIDAHVHLVCTADQAPFVEAAGQDDSILEERAKANAMAALKAGITTLRDAGGKGSVTVRVRNALRASEFPAPTVMVCGMPITTPGGHLHFFGLTAHNGDDLMRALDRLADMGVDFIKVMASGGIQTPGSDPFASQFSYEQLAQLVQAAHRLGVRVAAHAHSFEAIRAALAAGVDTLEHLTLLCPPSEDPDIEGLVREARVKRVFVDPTAVALDAALEGREGWMFDQLAQIESAVIRRNECLRALARFQVDIIAGTDAGSEGVVISDFGRGLQLLAGILGWDAQQAIRSATYASAAALGVAEEVGSIAAGKRADIVVVEGDPREDLSALSRVVLVLKEGRVAFARPDVGGMR